MSIEVRQSPSGPVVLELGSGFVTRQSSERYGIVGGSAVMTENIPFYLGSDGTEGAAVVASMENLKPSAEYTYDISFVSRVNGALAVGTYTVELTLEVSASASGPWVPITSNIELQSINGATGVSDTPVEQLSAAYHPGDSQQDLYVRGLMTARGGGSVNGRASSQGVAAAVTITERLL